MAGILLLYKCWNCSRWGDFRFDSECECGVHVYEDSDPHSSGQQVETLIIDVNEAAIACRMIIRAEQLADEEEDYYTLLVQATTAAQAALRAQ